MGGRYSAPAGIDDAARGAHPDALRKAWHDKVSGFVAEAKDRSGFFYDQFTDSPQIPDSQPSLIPWNAYPKWITTVFEGFPGALDEGAADAFSETLRLTGLYTKIPGDFVLSKWSSRIQDEYCEWATVRKNNDIIAMHFTAEAPEYWETLFDSDPKLVVDLYRELLKNADVKEEDLRFAEDHYWFRQDLRAKGSYNPYNKWNVGPYGLVHLTQPNNTLGAEVALAADGTVDWVAAGLSPTEQSLICCSQYGDSARHSDPRIGWTVNDLVSRTGACAALADPVGLYMSPFELDDLLDPNGHPIGDAALSFPRKSADGSRILRAEVRVPEGATYGLQDCTLSGRPLVHGGQIARRITMGLYAVAKVIPGRMRSQSGCRGFCCPHPQSPKLIEGFTAENGPDCAHLKPNSHRPLPPDPHGGPTMAYIVKELVPRSLESLDTGKILTRRSRLRY